MSALSPFLLTLMAILFSWPIRADERIRPRNAHELSPNTVQEAVRVIGARVSYANFAALRRDFPQIASLNDTQIAQWILDNFAFISQEQLRLNGIRNTDIPVDQNIRTRDYRPPAYGRAGVLQAQHNGEFIGLVDIKGLGLAEGKAESQVQSFHKANGDPKLENNIRMGDHNDGLMRHGEAIAEVTRQTAVQRLFDIYNSGNNTDFQTVESYFVIELPFDVMGPNNRRDRAALYGRQAHWRGLNNIPGAAKSLYRDPFGGQQSTIFGSAVDFGGVLVDKDPRLAEAFRVPHGGKENDPQQSRPWAWGHDTARAFREGDTSAVYRHLDEMLAPIQHDWKIALSSMTPRLSDTERAIQNLSDPNVLDAELQKAARNYLTNSSGDYYLNETNAIFFRLFGSRISTANFRRMLALEPRLKRSELIKIMDSRIFIEMVNDPNPNIRREALTYLKREADIFERSLDLIHALAKVATEFPEERENAVRIFSATLGSLPFDHVTYFSPVNFSLAEWSGLLEGLANFARSETNSQKERIQAVDHYRQIHKRLGSGSHPIVSPMTLRQEVIDSIVTTLKAIPSIHDRISKAENLNTSYPNHPELLRFILENLRATLLNEHDSPKKFYSNLNRYRHILSSPHLTGDTIHSRMPSPEDIEREYIGKKLELVNLLTPSEARDSLNALLGSGTSDIRVLVAFENNIRQRITSSPESMANLVTDIQTYGKRFENLPANQTEHLTSPKTLGNILVQSLLHQSQLRSGDFTDLKKLEHLLKIATTLPDQPEVPHLVASAMSSYFARNQLINLSDRTNDTLGIRDTLRRAFEYLESKPIDPTLAQVLADYYEKNLANPSYRTEDRLPLLQSTDPQIRRYALASVNPKFYTNDPFRSLVISALKDPNPDVARIALHRAAGVLAYFRLSAIDLRDAVLDVYLTKINNTDLPITERLQVLNQYREHYSNHSSRPTPDALYSSMIPILLNHPPQDPNERLVAYTELAKEERWTSSPHFSERRFQALKDAIAQRARHGPNPDERLEGVHSHLRASELKRVLDKHDTFHNQDILFLLTNALRHESPNGQLVAAEAIFNNPIPVHNTLKETALGLLLDTRDMNKVSSAIYEIQKLSRPISNSLSESIVRSLRHFDDIPNVTSRLFKEAIRLQINTPDYHAYLRERFLSVTDPTKAPYLLEALARRYLAHPQKDQSVLDRLVQIIDPQTLTDNTTPLNIKQIEALQVMGAMRALPSNVIDYVAKRIHELVISRGDILELQKLLTLARHSGIADPRILQEASEILNRHSAFPDSVVQQAAEVIGELQPSFWGQRRLNRFARARSNESDAFKISDWQHSDQPAVRRAFAHSKPRPICIDMFAALNPMEPGLSLAERVILPAPLIIGVGGVVDLWHFRSNVLDGGRSPHRSSPQLPPSPEPLPPLPPSPNERDKP